MEAIPNYTILNLFVISEEVYYVVTRFGPIVLIVARTSKLASPPSVTLVRFMNAPIVIIP
jgi:hypothetical protein